RQPSREIYGRMDISVAHAESGESGTPATETAPPPERSHMNRGPARPRTGSSLPTGPDPAVVFKYVKWGAIALGALILLFIVISLLPSKRGSSSGGSGVSSVPRGASFGL